MISKNMLPDWEIDSEYGTLREVLLSEPNLNFEFVPINSVAKKSIALGE